MTYEPRPSDRFTIGLWCTAFGGREVFGTEVRAPLDPLENIRRLAGLGLWGFNFHDDDLVPFGSSVAETDRILAEARRVMDETGIACSMATCNMFEQPVFRDGALTSRDVRVRTYARQKAMRAVDMGAELGASVYVMWGGREGLEVEASRDPLESIKHYREGVEFVAGYIRDQGYEMRIAIEPKPNEPRGDIFLPTAGHVLGIIATLETSAREIVGVNPEVQHSRMVNINVVHDVGQVLEAGKLYHIDLGAQKATRFDQDLRFGSEDLKETFFLVRMLTRAGWDGPRAFDVKPYRTDTPEEVWDLVRGCIRSYLVLREKAEQFDADPDISAILDELDVTDAGLGEHERYSVEAARALRATAYDLEAMADRRLGYQRLDQLTFDLLTGTR
jgi:xylose isomerase